MGWRVFWFSRHAFFSSSVAVVHAVIASPTSTPGAVKKCRRDFFCFFFKGQGYFADAEQEEVEITERFQRMWRQQCES
jgi:hypothetical protein